MSLPPVVGGLMSLPPVVGGLMSLPPVVGGLMSLPPVVGGSCFLYVSLVSGVLHNCVMFFVCLSSSCVLCTVW